MGCEEIRDLLALYAGGETHENERVAVEAHVGLCAACARELDQYREMRANLAALREEDAPSGTWKALGQAVREELFPRRASRAVALLDAALRYAAALMVGLAIGAAIYVSQRGPSAAPSARIAPAPKPDVLKAAVRPETGAVENVTEAPSRPKFHAPRARAEGNFYLPHVESIPSGGDKDF